MRQRTSSLRESVRSPYAAAQAPASGMQNEMLGALNALKRIVEVNKQNTQALERAQYGQQTQPSLGNKRQTINEVIDELQENIDHLPFQDAPPPQQDYPSQEYVTFARPAPQSHAFRHQYRPRLSNDEFEQTLSEIEARQLEIAQGIKKPQFVSGKPFTYSHPENLHQVNADKQRSKAELELLKRDISTISSALNDKTPRLQINELVTMVEDLGSQVKNASQYKPTVPQVENYGSQLEGILNRLDNLKPLANLVGIELEIQKLSKKLESFRNSEIAAPETHYLNEQINALRKDFSQSQQAEQINIISENVKNLSLQIANLWELANQKNAKIIRLEDKIDLFRKREETRSAPFGENGPLYEEFKELKSFVEKAVTTPKSNDNDDFRSLETKIDSLAGIINNPRNYQEDFMGINQHQPNDKVVALEQMLNAVVMKLDAIQSSSQSSKGSINQLETMLLALAQKIDQTDRQFSRLNSLESQVNMLETHRSQTNHTSFDYAQNSVETKNSLDQRQPQTRSDFNVEPSQQSRDVAPAPIAPKRALDRLMQRIQPQAALENTYDAPVQPSVKSAQPQQFKEVKNRVTFSKPLDTGAIPSDLPLEVGLGSPIGKNLQSLKLNLNDTTPQAKISAENPSDAQASNKKSILKNSSALTQKFAPLKKSLIVGLVATLVLFGGLALIKMWRSPAVPQTISLNQAPAAKILSPKESSVQTPSAVTPQKPAADAQLFDPITTGSVSAKSNPPALPGVAVANGWQPLSPTNVEKNSQANQAKIVAAVKKLAEQGNVAAQYDYANRLMEGNGVTRNSQEAFNYFKKAADAAIVPAHFKLGSLYEKGLGVAKNLSEARRHYLAAAGKGHARAMHNLAVVSADNSDGNGDVKVAALWFRRAAEHGVADSQFNLAILYARGQGVEQSLVESYKWFAIAAKKGDRDAAQKRDQIEKRLSGENLSVVKMAVETFTPKQEPSGINHVPIPAGGWEATLNKS